MTTLSFRHNAPYAEAFEDIYFNPDHGWAETDYVFLKANALEARFSSSASFSIGELGFGTGLNFLATLELWLRIAPPQSTLHYFSIEKFPLNLDDLKKVHPLFPGLAGLARLLQQNYPHLITGMHTLTIIPNRVTLYVCFGDVMEWLPEIEGPIDAWFLDGFAPRKNPDMWSLEVMQALARRSGPSTTLSTFSAAGSVRRTLEQAGFQSKKIKGFGIKKEMTTARFLHAFKSSIAPWFARPTSPQGKRIAIIGGGLAGLMSAHHLHMLGLTVDLFDENEALPNRQCHNPAMLLKPYFSPNLNFFDQYFTAGYFGMARFIEALAPEAIIAKGIETIPITMRAQEKQQKLVLKRALPDELTHAGFVINPNLLTRALLAETPLTLHPGKKVNPEHLLPHFDAILIATGHYSEMGKPTPGQVSIAKETPLSAGNIQPFTYEGYCIPDGRGHRILGSSFRRDISLEVRADDHLQNLNYLKKAAPELADAFAQQRLDAFVGMRYTTPDHLPIVGGLPLQAEWLQTYARLRFGDRRVHYPEAPYVPATFLTLAHGSKGLSSSFLASRIIGSLLTGQPLPIGISLWDAIHPARFWLRSLKCAV